MKVIESPEGVARLVGDVPAAPAETFRWFTDPDLLVRWWPEHAAIDEIRGGFEFSWPEQDVRLLGEYVLREPPGRLVFTWAFTHESSPPRTVDIRFDESEVGTLLTIDHTHGGDPDERQGYIDGWKFFIERLREELAAPGVR